MFFPPEHSSPCPRTLGRIPLIPFYPSLPCSIFPSGFLEFSVDDVPLYMLRAGLPIFRNLFTEEDGEQEP